MEEKKDTFSGHLRRREPKNRTINIRLSETDLERINRISIEEDISVAQLIRKAVKKYDKDSMRKP